MSRLGPQLPLPLERGYSLLSDVRLNLVPIDVIVRQRGVNMGQVQMRVFQSDFLRGHTHFVPDRDSADGQSRPGNLRPSATNLRVAVDQSSDFNRRRHVSSLPRR